MSKEQIVLCGEARQLEGQFGKELKLGFAADNPPGPINLKISDIHKKLIANLPPVCIDLLEIAAYVYSADQATTRGNNSAWNYGANWRRDFTYHIPVRALDVWRQPEVQRVLTDTLSFLSDDLYSFNFSPMKAPQTIEQYLDFDTGSGTGFVPDEVVLFSGGLDSLGGVIEETIIQKRKAVLVSHRSSPKLMSRQKRLVDELKRLSDNRILHVPVWANKDKALGKEYTQRSRSFLYASLAAVVARIFGLEQIRFYENGVISVNLPISQQVIGGRATRTTHPRVLNGFAELFSLLFDCNFKVENPFLWKTKTEVVQHIRATQPQLIKYSFSCVHTWDTDNLKTHCGKCSQCIDRRFATLAAGCSDEEEPVEMYGVDLQTGERESGEDLTLLESYILAAREVQQMGSGQFFTAYGEATQAVNSIQLSVNEAGSNLFDLYKRHANSVCGVMTESLKNFAAEVTAGTLPTNCMVILAFPDKYRNAPKKDQCTQPVLILDDLPKDGTYNSKGWMLALLHGNGKYGALKKALGAKQLFCLFYLFKSEKTHKVGSRTQTVVGYEELATYLLIWANNALIQLSGDDQNKPEYRVMKMFGSLQQQFSKGEAVLSGILEKTVIEGKNHISIRHLPHEMAVHMSSLPATIMNKSASGQ